MARKRGAEKQWWERYDWYETPEWRRLRQACFQRDLYRCVRCKRHFPNGKGLTVHHIIPRDAGGPHHLWNLVSLCGPCHDLVEVLALRNRAQIMGSGHLKLSNLSSPRRTEGIPEVTLPRTRSHWHKVTYGGQPSPPKFNPTHDLEELQQENARLRGMNDLLIDALAPLTSLLENRVRWCYELPADYGICLLHLRDLVYARYVLKLALEEREDRP